MAAPEDAGSIYSDVRIRLDKLNADISAVKTGFDKMDSYLANNTKKIQGSVENLTKAYGLGAIKQETFISRSIALREQELLKIQNSVVKKGKATAEELAQIKKIEGALEKLAGEQTKLKTNSDTNTTGMTKNFDKLKLAGTGAIIGITIAFKQAIKTFTDTEQQLANVRAVSNSSAKDFKLLEDAAKNAGVSTRFTASEAADALFFLSSAGLKATESVKALDGVLLLAGATGSGLAESSQAITSTLSQFGLEASKAADVSNIFAAANSNSQATLDKLANSLRQVGPVAAGLGIGLEETVGSLQALFNAGFQGENAGRALKSALADLANEASPTIKKLDALGVSFSQVDPTVVGLTGAIGALEAAGITTAQVIDVFGKEAGPQLATLIGEGQTALEDYTSAVTGTNEAARQYAIQNDTLAGSQDAFKSALEGTTNSFIEQLAPAFRFVIDLGTGFLKIINLIPDVLKGVGAGAGTAALGMGILTKALALIGVTLGAGPLALVTLIGGVVVGLTSMVKKSQEVRQVKLAEEFGDLAKELGKSGTALDDFLKTADLIEGALVKGFGQNFEETSQQIKDISNNLGISEKEIIAIGKSSKNVSDEYKAQLTTLQDQIIQQEDLQTLLMSQVSIEEAISMSKLNQERTEARIAKEKAISEKIDQDRIDRLAEIQKEVLLLDELSRKGAISEIELLEEKSALRQEEIDLLLAQAITSGVVSAQTIKDIEAQKNKIEEYQARLKVLNTSQKDGEKKVTESVGEELVARDLELETYIATSKRAYDEYMASLENKEQSLSEFLAENWQETAGTVVDIASNLYNTLVNARVDAANAEIAELERVTDAQLKAIDEETQALLKAQGLQEETKLESLQRQLDASILAGETETTAELEKEIARTKILQDASDRKDVIEKEAARKTADLKYDADIAAWEASKYNTAIAGAQAAISAYGALAPIPVLGPGLGIAAALAVGAATLKQLSVIDKNKPKKQTFATGGIVLPESGVSSTGDRINIGVNPNEMILTQQQQAQLFKMANGGGGGNTGDTMIQLFMDSKVVAQGVARNFNNGVVKVTLK